MIQDGGADIVVGTRSAVFAPLENIGLVIIDEEQLWADVSAVTAQALDNFIAMRAAEGAKMKADVESRLCFRCV